MKVKQPKSPSVDKVSRLVSPRQRTNGNATNERANKPRVPASQLLELARKLGGVTTNTVTDKKLHKKKTDRSLKGVLNAQEKENQPRITPNFHLIDKEVFAVFDKFRTDVLSTESLDALVQLMRKESPPDVQTATCTYILKRLIRAAAADDANAVVKAAGAMFLVMRCNKTIDGFDILKTLKAELATTESGKGKGKEDSLAGVGQIIVAYCMLQLPNFQITTKPPLVVSVYEVFLSHLIGREYLFGMCTAMLSECFEQLPIKVFVEYIWPMLKKNIAHPMDSQTVEGLDILMTVQRCFPKFYTRQNLLETLYPDGDTNLPEFFKMFVHGPYNKAVLKRFAKFLVADRCKLFTDWQAYVDSIQPIKQKSTRANLMRIFADVLIDLMQHHRDQIRKVINLFSRTTVEFVLRELLNVKQTKRSPKDRPIMLALRNDCYEFEGLVHMVIMELGNTEHSFNLFMRFLEPKISLEETFSMSNFVNNIIEHFSSAWLEKLYQFYYEWMLSQTEKARQMRCLNQMQYILHNPNLCKNFREKSLNTILLLGLFHHNDKQEICAAKDASTMSRLIAPRCQEIFMGCLMRKSNGLKELAQRLRPFVLLLDNTMRESEDDALIRPLNGAFKKSWAIVQAQLARSVDSKGDGEGDVVPLAFDALLLFFGLALCIDPKLSVGMLVDLDKCRKRATNDTPTRKSPAVADEPRWQDVLTDIILQFLLQTGYVWRAFSNMLVAALMPHMQSSNLQQILNMINVRENPFDERPGEEEQDDDDDDDDDDEDGRVENVKKEEDVEMDSDESDEDYIEEEECEEEDSDYSDEDISDEDDEDDVGEGGPEEDGHQKGDGHQKKDDDQKKDGHQKKNGDQKKDGHQKKNGQQEKDGHEEDSADETDSDSESNVEDDDDDETTDDGTDKSLPQLRNNVREALLFAGDDDAASVDWNDVSDEHGQALNHALEQAFQLMKPKKSKQARVVTKRERVDDTALLHFRIRVLDLVELFATKKRDFEMTLDCITSIFEVIYYCAGEAAQKALYEASQKLLKKLLAQELEVPVSADKSCFLEAIKKVMSVGQAADEERDNKSKRGNKSKTPNQWRDKCFAYFVCQAFNDEIPTKSLVWPMFTDYVNNWVTSRKSKLTVATFDILFNSSWTGASPLAIMLASHLSVSKTRTFRRVQIVKLLSDQHRRLNIMLRIPGNEMFIKEIERFVAQLEATGEAGQKELEQLTTLTALLGRFLGNVRERVNTMYLAPHLYNAPVELKKRMLYLKRRALVKDDSLCQKKKSKQTKAK
ncbi:hypothetical protein KR018_008767 [Drosophila ironensis]|nr:hypothetical protein KR018_008767 [Drosophila ironensis]